MKELSAIVFSVLLLQAVTPSYSQPGLNKNISGDFQNIKFATFASQIEGRPDYKFFYDQKSVDSLMVNVSIESKPIDFILDQVFVKTDFHYAIDQNGNIYVVKEWRFKLDWTIHSWTKMAHKHNLAWICWRLKRKRNRG